MLTIEPGYRTRLVERIRPQGRHESRLTDFHVIRLLLSIVKVTVSTITGRLDAHHAKTENNVFAKEFAALDAVLARSTRALLGVSDRPRDPRVYDEEFDDDRMLAVWREKIDDLGDLPPVIALDAWIQKIPLQPKPWLGTLLASSLRRANGKARHHLPTLNVGLRAIAHERRRARDDGARLVALLEAINAAAEQGLKDTTAGASPTATSPESS